MRRPAFQFYPSDWRKDMALQSCSVAARGLWIDLLCIAHECDPYGHLIVNGRPMTAAQIGRHTGLSRVETQRLIDELEQAGVLSRTADGAIYSRRMVRDEDIRNRRAEGGILGAEHGIKGKEFGKLGGNPKKKSDYNEPGKLYAVQRTSGGPIKVGITKYPSQRVNGIRKKIGEELLVLGVFDVDDMGRCEAAVHAEFDGRLDGEWIHAEWGEIEQVIRGATHPPLQPPPSSSSSTSVSKATSNEVARPRPPDEYPPPAAQPQLSVVAKPAPYTPPDCPHALLLALWAEVLPELPRHNPEMWRGTRAYHLRARWRETADAKRWPDRDAGLAYFRKLFAYCAKSPFLMGHVGGRNGRRPFVIELEWLVQPVNWAKVHEGKYHEEAAA